MHLSIAHGTLKYLVHWIGFNKHVLDMETCLARPYQLPCQTSGTTFMVIATPTSTSIGLLQPPYLSISRTPTLGSVLAPTSRCLPYAVASVHSYHKHISKCTAPPSRPHLQPVV
jgi:hypothetical protein